MISPNALRKQSVRRQPLPRFVAERFRRGLDERLSFGKHGGDHGEFLRGVREKYERTDHQSVDDHGKPRICVCLLLATPPNELEYGKEAV
jgi:hypothetical protein